MKRLSLLLFLLSLPAWANISLYNRQTTSTAGGITSTTITLSKAAQANDVVIVLVEFAGNVHSLSSVSGGGATWTLESAVFDSVANHGGQLAYAIGLSAGTTQITLNFPSALQFGVNIAIDEWAPGTGNVIQFDAYGSNDITTACTSCSGIALSLGGSNDAIFQAAINTSPSGTSWTAVSSPYSFNTAGKPVAFGESFNTTSGAAPTWTDGTSNRSEVFGIAFKEISGGGSNNNSYTAACAGTGNGTITSSPAGINAICTAGTTSGTATASFPLGTAVTLNASALAGSSFVSYSGAGCATSPCPLGGYSTTFPGQENPLSQSHVWVNGGHCSDSTLCLGLTSGWPGSHNMQSQPGEAYGTQTGTAGCSAGGLTVCDDSAAAVNGSWTPNQTITGVAKIVSPNHDTEIELHLLSNIPSGHGKLYEVDIRATNGTDSFMNIARWNGDGTFTALCVNNGSTFGVSNGDTIVANAVVSGATVTIKVLKNGTQMLTCTDSSAGAILTGNPGMGAFQNLDIPASSEPNFGWSSWMATADSTTTATITGTFNLNGGGNSIYSVTNQQPTNYEFYPGSYMVMPLPATITSHNQSNSTAIINNIFSGGFTSCSTDNCTILYQLPSQGGGGNAAFYYGTSSDPIYKVIGTWDGLPSSATYSPVGKYFHCPSGMINDNNAGDSFMLCWDQSTDIDSTSGGRILSFYNPHLSLPSCSCTTQTCADNTSNCQISKATGNGYGHYGEVGFPQDSVIYGTDRSSSGYASLRVEPAAGFLRDNELISGDIEHALVLNVNCEAQKPGNSSLANIVFPSTGFGAQPCAYAGFDGNAASSGSLIYIDSSYNCTTLPVWQRGVCKAMQNYGGYVSDTGGAVNSIGHGWGTVRAEGGMQYALKGVTWPFLAWALGQSGNGFTLRGNPVNGANMPFWNMPGVQSHVHIADPCVASGLAGLTGSNQVSGNPTPCAGGLWVKVVGSGTVRSTVVNGTFNPMICNTAFNGTNCYLSGDGGTTVDLIAQPLGGQSFTGWSACSPGADCISGCSGTGTCRVSMNVGNTSGLTVVTANFSSSPPPTFNVTAAASGSGSGTITSSPSGIACAWNGSSTSGTCGPVAFGGTVTFTASPASGSKFTGWTVTGTDAGACTGTGPCALTPTGADTVSAAFAASSNAAPGAPIVSY